MKKKSRPPPQVSLDKYKVLSIYLLWGVETNVTTPGSAPARVIPDHITQPSTYLSISSLPPPLENMPV